MNPILKQLFTREELQEKIEQHTAEYEKLRIENNYHRMAFQCYDIARYFELLEEKEKSNCYYQKIVDLWNAHLGKVPDWICVIALKALKRPEEALQVVCIHPEKWMPITLAHLYKELGKEYEARLLYAGLANHSVELSEAYYLWQPHNLQDAANLWERTKHPEKAQICNQRAVEAWGKMKGDRDYDPIEKAWLYEEVGYIYEKAGKLKTAMEYYQKAESKYELAYTSKYLASTESNQIDGDWERYKGHFILQIPDFRLINFDSDRSQGNDYRRIKYRILNLKANE